MYLLLGFSYIFFTNEKYKVFYISGLITCVDFTKDHKLGNYLENLSKN